MIIDPPPDHEHPPRTSVGAWAKSYHFAVRAAMESALRPYDLGSTQFYVLRQLANHGPTMQRDLGRTLQIERATRSAIVPDPLALIRAIAFDGSDAAELAIAVRVLQSATQRLNDHMAAGRLPGWMEVDQPPLGSRRRLRGRPRG